MKKNTTSESKLEIFPTVISLETRVKAQKFRAYQSQPSLGKQVYLNTLAVSAVNIYLHSIGWATNLAGSDSQNPVLQTMMDTADLQIPGYGKLECRYVMAGNDTANIPPEVWTERIGYIVVRLSLDLERADLLGFVSRVDRSTLSLDRLESLAEFPAYLSLQKRAAPLETVVISNWFTQQFDRGWHHLEELFAPTVALNFRSPQKLANSIDRLHPQINSVKLIRFAENVNIALVLNIQSPNNLFCDLNAANKELESSWRSQEYNISMTVCNSHVRNLLPPGLELIIFDSDNRPVMIAQASENQNIEFCFSGKLGESFRVELALGEQVKVESFII